MYAARDRFDHRAFAQIRARHIGKVYGDDARIKRRRNDQARRNLDCIGAYEMIEGLGKSDNQSDNQGQQYKTRTEFLVRFQ